MLNKNTGKAVERNENGREIFKCPKCGEIHIIGFYVYAHMSFDVITHTCDCGTKTKFYKDVMHQSN